MCLILFSLQQHPLYKVVIAANRDEFFGRKTAAANFWTDHADVIGGRDLEAGGTWMGMSRSGKIAMVTNYRDPANIRATAPSRGKLVSDFLTGNAGADEYLNALQSSAPLYNGFNLLAGDARSLFYFSNYSAGRQHVSAGIHGLSNHLLDTPWPKVERGKTKLRALLTQDRLTPADLFQLLYDEQQAAENQLPDTGIGKERERALSSMFIKTPGYGTRCSTVVLITNDDRVHYEERVYDLTTYAYSTASFDFKIL